MTIEEHLKKEINFIQNQIKKGKTPNRGNLDGYTLKGLNNKLNIIIECLHKLQTRNVTHL